MDMILFGVTMPLLDPKTSDGDFVLFDRACASFFQSIKNHYTPETASEAMNALIPVLGKEWRDRLIFGLISDTIENRFLQMRISQNPKRVSEKIHTIIEIQRLTGLTISESKNIVDDTDSGSVTFDIIAPRHLGDKEWKRQIMASLEAIRSFGFCVNII